MTAVRSALGPVGVHIGVGASAPPIAEQTVQHDLGGDAVEFQVPSRGQEREAVPARVFGVGSGATE